MTQTIFISLGCSLVVAIFYGFVIANKEDVIREYLKNSATGIFRKIYVTALISAVRGRDKLSDSLNIYYLLVLAVIVLSLSYHFHLNNLVSDYSRNIRWIEEDAALSLQEKYEKSSSQLEELKEAAKKNGPSVEKLKNFSSGLYVFAFSSAYIFIFIFRPYLLIRKRFSHEVGLYSTRIQGLAAKAELAEIAVLESKVKDEESLKKYIECTKAVAERHGVIELVSKFDLW